VSSRRETDGRVACLVTHLDPYALIPRRSNPQRKYKHRRTRVFADVPAKSRIEFDARCRRLNSAKLSRRTTSEPNAQGGWSAARLPETVNEPPRCDLRAQNDMCDRRIRTRGSYRRTPRHRIRFCRCSCWDERQHCSKSTKNVGASQQAAHDSKYTPASAGRGDGRISETCMRRLYERWLRPLALNRPDH
jgi:hypothetical protein